MGLPTSSATTPRRAGFCGGAACCWSTSTTRSAGSGAHRPTGSLPSYEFNWTVADYVTAQMHGGCELEAIREIGDQREWRESAPLAGLPNTLLLVGRKR